MAKNVLRRAHSRTTKLLTIHSRSAPVFLSNARGEPTFGLCRQKGFNKPHLSPCAKKVLIPGPRDRRSSLCFMMLQKIAGGGDFVKKQILRGGGSEIFQSFFVMNRIVRLWHFFQKILLFSSCFEAVNSNPPPPGGACVAKLTPGQHKNQISTVLKGVFIC